MVSYNKSRERWMAGLIPRCARDYSEKTGAFGYTTSEWLIGWIAVYCWQHVQQCVGIHLSRRQDVHVKRLFLITTRLIKYSVDLNIQAHYLMQFYIRLVDRYIPHI